MRWHARTWEAVPESTWRATVTISLSGVACVPRQLGDPHSERCRLGESWSRRESHLLAPRPCSVPDPTWDSRPPVTGPITIDAAVDVVP